MEEDEVSQWANFCALCFSYKANPPPSSYFERHYFNDPRRDPSWIRVATNSQGELVASVRIFKRTISIKNGAVDAGGIGEVCTKPSHRRLGISKMLLQNALSIMKQQGIKLSFLHAAPDFQPVYAKEGFVAVSSKWSILTLTTKLVLPQQDELQQFQFREASFPQDTERLMEIHIFFSEERFSGCILRSKEYWERYLSAEGTIYVLVHNHQVCSWISLRPNQTLLQMRDFGNDCSVVSTEKALSLLIHHAIVPNTDENRTLHLPTPIIQDIAQRDGGVFDIDNCISKDDNGWMWKSLLAPDDEGYICMQQVISTTNFPHLIWPLDSF